MTHDAAPPAHALPLLRVLLILPYAPAAFMQADVDLLDRHFDLDQIVHTRGKRRLLLGVVRRLLLNRPDLLLCWFIVPSYALALTLLAKLLGIKVGFITGGYDIVSMPSIGFGALRFPLFRLLLRPTLALADVVLPFSQQSARQVRKYGRPRRVAVLYPGVDVQFFRPAPARPREPLAVTVSPVTAVAIRQKGLRTFVEAARYAPETHFVLVGRSPDGSIAQLRALAPPNVEFVERFVSAEELRDLYQRANCYVQASVHEGFGIAVAEAMACGTVPLVTQRFSLPEVTGGLWEYIPLDDPQALARAVQRCRVVTPAQRRAFRRRIVETYPLRRRETELVAALLDTVSGRRALAGSGGTAPIKLDLGCGSVQRPGCFGIDARPTPATALVADAQALPIAAAVADEVYASCLLEHFDAPARVLDEIHRVLKPTGRAILRLPNLGTYSSHLDTTHRFLADLALWRSLLTGYFAQVEVQPVGTKYRDSRSLVAVNWLLVNGFKWYELAQGWDFICTDPRPEPVLSYIGWWEEATHPGRVGGQF
ncbi:MAG: glycosyltransferase [Chloroflexota bacterium]|nr:glycosyltransferase [Chloroflexota bacterium]